MIEIKSKDEINQDNILDSDESMFDEKALKDIYINYSIYILHYNKG